MSSHSGFVGRGGCSKGIRGGGDFRGPAGRSLVMLLFRCGSRAIPVREFDPSPAGALFEKTTFSAGRAWVSRGAVIRSGVGVVVVFSLGKFFLAFSGPFWRGADEVGGLFFYLGWQF